ncbi:MAG TPA: trehalose-6-phosphate synthase [Actinomycetota bacterium]|nr:trehalose-6-phosphate synthase [Actinomycetota bacterium]
MTERHARPATASDAVDAVLASNRGPFSFRPSPTGILEAHEGVGAVAEALATVAHDRAGRTTWVACPVSEHDYTAVANGTAAVSARALPYEAVHVLPERPALHGYYDGMSNGILWPACHDLWDDLGLEVGDWDGNLRAYDDVNRLFADALARHSSAAAVVSLHDYHVLRVARHLRRLQPDRRVGLFLHVPWRARGFSRLPERLVRAVVDGMLGADVVGFQTTDWIDEFLETCETLGYEVDAERRSVRADRDRWSWMKAYPVALEPAKVERLARTPHAERWAAEIDGGVSRPLIARVDRIEPSKNQIRGFEAFEVLERGGGFEHATFVACLIPRRAEIPAYRRYRAALEARAEAINRARPGAVRLYVGEDRERALALLRLHDVLLVNSVADGMNLVAKEGALLNENDGALVVSSTVGAARELGEGAIVIDDPRDVQATAQALGRALSLPSGERARRAALLRRHVARDSPAAWFRDQVEDLLHVRDHGRPRPGS